MTNTTFSSGRAIQPRLTIPSGSQYVHLRGGWYQRERAQCWRNLTEYSSPYKVGLIQMVQRLLKALVYLADFHGNVCLHGNVRFVSQIVWCALSFNKRCTICISLSLTIKRGKRLVKPFIFILTSKWLSKSIPFPILRFGFRFFSEFCPKRFQGHGIDNISIAGH